MDPRAISEQIGRILRSRTFASKGQLRKLLEVLHRNMDSEIILTGDEVIKELWPTETRTKRSADVATEMNRLRRALKSYYAAEGARDPIVISLPSRAATAGNGVHERPWMVADSRATTNDNASGDPANARAIPALKIAAVVAALCALLVGYLTFPMWATRPRPQFGRLDGSILRWCAWLRVPDRSRREDRPASLPEDNQGA